jgi:hypothetical protein
MMRDYEEGQKIYLAGKKQPITITIIRGRPHIRTSIAIPLEQAEKLYQKANLMNRDTSLIINILIENFNIATGVIGTNKNAGCLYDSRPEKQAEQSAFEFWRDITDPAWIYRNKGGNGNGNGQH